MKFLIKFTFFKDGTDAEGELRVWAEDARYALRVVETDLDVLGAKGLSVMPLENLAYPQPLAKA